ncbi:MAG: hypothetical protein LBP52_10590, partial [Burkholderiaceae bacterium]|nr:hypothetical protein [Burkholderiaceae bacterium]
VAKRENAASMACVFWLRADPPILFPCVAALLNATQTGRMKKWQRPKAPTEPVVCDRVPTR